MSISKIGFGAWAIGGSGWHHAWGSQDDGDSIAAIREAVSRGVNWVDTAPVYGLGHSEEVVGRALADLGRDRPFVFTKVGLEWDESSRGKPPRRTMRPESVRREVDASLRRLGVDRIDLYQVHWPDPNTPLEEYWQVMADLREQGKVAAIGLSNHDVEQLNRAERVAHVDAIQPPFSAITRSAAHEISWAAANGTAVIVYSPMHSGLLTGAFSAERVAALPDDDWRRRSEEFTTNLAANLDVAEAIRAVADRRGVSAAAIAVAWTLAWPGVTGAIVGARRAAQVADWSNAASVNLDDKDLDEIAQRIESAGAGSGPVRP